MSKTMLLLKTVGSVGSDGSAYNGFKWPLEVGAVVTAPDWKPTASCGNGLHGIPWGEGDGSLLNWSNDAKWIVFEAPEKDVICFDRKAKCHTAIVRCVGSLDEAAEYLAKHGKPGVYGGSTASGVGGEATASGVGGKATAGEKGTIIIHWQDGDRIKVAVGYIGEDGLLPNVAYRFDAKSQRFVEATQ